jgi:hypothetical protein
MKKTINLAVFILLQITTIFAQTDITQTKEFQNALSPKPESRIEKCILYYKDGAIQDGYMAFEASDLDPNFPYVDAQRFGCMKDGKFKFQKLKFDKLDSFNLGDRHYKFMDIKVSNGLMSSTKKHAIFRVVKNFEKSALIKYVPEDIPFGNDGSTIKPLDMVWNKATNKFFQLETGLGSFTKGLKKLFEDCPSLAEEIQANKDAEPKTSILKKAMTDNTEKNMGIILEACEKYDACDTGK